MSFTKQLEKQSATEHQSATFVCETSKACPEVTWCKNGKEISPGKKYEMVSDGLVQRLTLRDVTMEDAGEFSLTIGDGVKSAADLVVQGRHCFHIWQMMIYLLVQVKNLYFIKLVTCVMN